MSGFRTIISILVLFFAQKAPAQVIGPSVDVPEWAKDAVWYQIFPERFWNGDPSNDPTLEDIRGSWPHIQPETWRVSRWTGDWYAREDWERAVSDEFYLTVQLRRYGGDIAGILEKLDYLDSLGITAIYLNPVFEAPSLHKYDGSFYHHIDNNFGPDPEGDRAIWRQENPLDPSTWQWTSADSLFLRLVHELHDRGKHVIIDGVFNHMGLRSFAFEDVRRYQDRSAFRDWFHITSWDDPTTPETDEFDYRGWMGVRELPELAEDENGLIEPVRDYIFNSVRRWMDPDGDGDPSDGIDGWRLDVAEMVNLRFWQAFRDTVRSINPEAYLVGEVWWEDWANFKMFNARRWLEGEAFDAVMNYRWAVAARKLFLEADLDSRTTYAPSDYVRDITQLLSEYPHDVNYVLMNTIGTHDTDRLASQVVNPETFFDHQVGVRDNPSYRVRKPNENERKTQKLILASQFTSVGAPHIFYGDEAGMWGADDPDERKPMVWEDLQFEPEAAHPLGLDRPRDENTFDRALFDYYRALVHVRNQSRALRRGSLNFILADDVRRLLAYERRFGDEVVWITFNLDVVPHTITLPLDAERPASEHTPARGSVLRDPLTGSTVSINQNVLSFELGPRSVRIWTLVP